MYTMGNRYLISKRSLKIRKICKTVATSEVVQTSYHPQNQQKWVVSVYHPDVQQKMLSLRARKRIQHVADFMRNNVYYEIHMIIIDCICIHLYTITYQFRRRNNIQSQHLYSKSKFTHSPRHPNSRSPLSWSQNYQFLMAKVCGSS